MPPEEKEEDKTQDTLQQDNNQAESVVVETPASVEQPTESAQAKTPIETIPEIISEPTTEPIEPPKTEEAQPQVAEKGPIAPLVQSAEPQPKAPPQPKEKIIYKTDPNIVQKLLIKARAKIQERKRKKLNKIILFLEAKPQITNKDIQKLLRISSATAVRYLNILERENRIKQVGNTGKSVFYTKI